MSSAIHPQWWLPVRWRKLTVVKVTRSVLDIPEQLPPRGAVLVTGTQNLKWLAFDCPCDTGHRIQLPLDPEHRPHWRVIRRRPLTLAPSVDSWQRGVHCHYVVRGGRIRWVPESRRS